jgi:hypothetical protein
MVWKFGDNKMTIDEIKNSTSAELIQKLREKYALDNETQLMLDEIERDITHLRFALEEDEF